MELKTFIIIILIFTNVFFVAYGYRTYRMYFKEKIYRMTLEKLIGHYKSINPTKINSDLIDTAFMKAWEQFENENRKN
ncbi:hypothetical protein BHU61_06635 [Macrococcus epidermidis]|uniref:Uncharacterized protein n=1 Tax=Macrococcus epidermidis TaxID=1902580 RepID=A0A327ZTY4_9STAP|nr:hypothetical protein [Macrococcus epidermidis]RAK44984.1 hypothetical protein BHU61_06635 [Macrococcus epidermidis]